MMKVLHFELSQVSGIENVLREKNVLVSKIPFLTAEKIFDDITSGVEQAKNADAIVISDTGHTGIRFTRHILGELSKAGSTVPTIVFSNQLGVGEELRIAQSGEEVAFFALAENGKGGFHVVREELEQALDYLENVPESNIDILASDSLPHDSLAPIHMENFTSASMGLFKSRGRIAQSKKIALPTISLVVSLHEVKRQITNKFEFCGFLLNRVSGEIQFKGEGLKLSPIGKKLLAALILAEGKTLPMEKLRTLLHSAKLSSRDGGLYDELSALHKTLRRDLQSLGYRVDQPLIEAVEGRGWRLSTDTLKKLTKSFNQEAEISDKDEFSVRLKSWFGTQGPSVLNHSENERPEAFYFHGFSCRRGVDIVEFRGRDIGLPKKESAAFTALLLAEGGPVQLKDIHAAIRSPEDTVDEGATGLLMLKSRKRLKNFLEKEGFSPEIPLIETVRGRGYRVSIDSLEILDGPPAAAKIIRLADRHAHTHG